MMNRKLSLLLAMTIISLLTSAQDVLPGFTIIHKGNDRIVVSWTNPYGTRIRQLSIQRSFDSIKNYKTILTVPDPTPPQNGYVDTKATTNHMFYRIYILLDSGKYLFSAVKRPAPDTAQTAWEGQTIESRSLTSEELEEQKKMIRKGSNDRMIILKKNNLLIGVIGDSYLKRFRDSVAYNTKDTLFLKSGDTLLIRPYIAKEYFQPSRYVFTEREGNIRISLPEASTKKYSVKFFEENNTEVFEIKHIQEPFLIVDKTNFIHSGWFSFELYEDGKLKEKHRLFVPKDF